MNRPPVERDDPSQRGASGSKPGSAGGDLTGDAVRGAVGGLIATAVMTLYRTPIFRALPPTAEFWARYVGPDDAERYVGPGLVLHFLYGGTAGAVLGVLFEALHAPLAGVASRLPVRRETAGVVAGLAYGIVLSLFGSRILLRRLLDQDLDPAERLVFHVGHVIYGLTLGTWLSTGERFGDVYE